MGGGEHEEGFDFWSPTNLGSNTSLAIDQLCDPDLRQVESQCSLVCTIPWRIRRISENMHEGLTHSGYSLNSSDIYNSDLPTPNPVLSSWSHHMKTPSDSKKPTWVKG